jgi:hypothetical protein
MSWDGYPDRKWAGHPPELWLGMLLYVLFMIAAGATLLSVERPGSWRYLAGLAPTLPILMVLRGYLRMVRHQDELYRRVQLEAIAIAAAITIVFSFTAWFLESFHVTRHVSIQWAGILLFFSYAVAAGVLMRRYT